MALMWITVDVERVLRVDRGINVILCNPMLGSGGPQTLVLKLKGSEMRASSKCWICGEEEPHTHSQDEVERARVRDTYADIIEPFVKSNYVMDETSRWEAKRIADALIAAGVRYSGALENIADWRNVNISGEHELGLRDIIRSMIDSAVDALDSPTQRPAPQEVPLPTPANLWRDAAVFPVPLSHSTEAPQVAMYRTAALARTSETVPANEDEAGRGLNDTFPGDPYPVAGVLQGIRQRSVQAMHAGISRRDWWATEVAANELRDLIDDLIRRLGTSSLSSSEERRR